MQAEEKVSVQGKFGLHLRAAGDFARVANGFRASVAVLMGGRQVDGKSILDMLSLGAAAGSQLTLRAEGDDAEEALAALLAVLNEPADTKSGKEAQADGD